MHSGVAIRYTSVEPRVLDTRQPATVVQLLLPFNSANRKCAQIVMIRHTSGHMVYRATDPVRFLTAQSTANL